MSGGSAAVKGMTWMFAGNTLTRTVGLAGQILIGWLLVPEDFGIYAFALSMSTAVVALRNGGSSQVVIQRGHEYHLRAGLFLRYSLVFNLIAMVLLLGVAVPFLLRSAPAGILILGTAISLPLGTPAMLYRAKLAIDRRFRELSTIGVWSAALWQGSVVCLAFCGLGAMSFAIAPILQAGYESLAGWRYVGAIPNARQKRPRQEYVQLFSQTRWIMLSAAAVALATTGVYFVVGVLTDARTVGAFFFAFQLVVAVSLPVYGAMETVFPPLLSQLGSDSARQISAYSRILRITVVAAVPLSIACALALPVSIHFVWNGKWDIAAPAAQILAGCIPAWLLITAGRALIEARGYWRTRFVILAIYGFGAIAAAAVGAHVGGVDAIALAVTLFYTTFAAVFLLCQAKLGLALKRIVPLVLMSLAVNFGALLLSFSAPIATRLSPDLHQWLILALFLAISGIGNALFFRHAWLDALKVVVQRTELRAQV